MSRHFKVVEFGYAKESEILPVIKNVFILIQFIDLIK